MGKKAFLFTHRRRRITGALAVLAERRGYAAVTFTDIVEEAGVSPTALEAEFADKGAVAIALLERAYEEMFTAASLGCAEAEAAEAGRHAVLDGAVDAVLAWVEEKPAVARACLVERYDVAEAGRLQLRAVDRFVEMLRHRAPPDPGRPRTVDEMVVGGAETMLRSLLVAGEGRRARSLAPSLGQFVRAPYERRW
jgi:AcrR family transcriptional regulator